MRKRLWQLHSWLGLVSGLGLLVIAITGSLLVFHEELAGVFTRERVVVAPVPGGRLPLDTLLAHAQRQLPAHEITGWHLRNDRADRADNLYVIGRGDNVWLTATLDPYTGRLLSAPHAMDATLHGWLVKLHSEFFASDVGLAFCGVLAVVLCLLGVSGVWLYREFWKHLFTFRWRRGARLLFSDFHKFVGITSVAFNLVLGFTGAYWNLTHTYEHLAGHEIEQPVIPGRLYPETLSLDAIVRDAPQRLAGFKTGFISLPSVPAAPAIILWGTIEPRPLLRNAYGTTLTYDLAGTHQATADLRDASAWKRATDTFESLHFGNFGGLPVKILWSLGGLTPGILAVTGFILWQLRRRGTASRSRASAPDTSVPAFSA